MAHTHPSTKTIDIGPAPRWSPRYRFERARIGLAEARFAQHKSFITIFGGTDLRIGVSETKFHEEIHLKLSSPSKTSKKQIKFFWVSEISYS